MSSSLFFVTGRQHIAASLFAAALMVGCGTQPSDSPPAAASPSSQRTPPAVARPAAGPALPPAAIDDIPAATAKPGDWPWWMGPTRNHVAEPGQTPVTSWSDTENVVWKIKLPGRGHATPCVVGKRIFVPTADKAQQQIRMHCFDRETGKELWETLLWDGPLRKIHKDNSYAAATPACDGEHIYFPYQTAEDVRIAALGLDGRKVWEKVVAPYESIQGFSASPVLHKAAVIIVVDGKGGSKLTAYHRDTGQLVWDADVPDTHESYASAMVGRSAGRDQIVMVGPDDLMSYDPNTGHSLWTCVGPAKCYVAGAVFDQTRVYTTGGYPKKSLYAINADGAGTVTETHLAWKSDRKAPYVPSLLLDEGLIYAVNDDGLMRCYRAESGEIVWEHDLDTKFYSSPVMVGGRIYLFDRAGKGFVLKAGMEWGIVAENSLPDGSFATPAICGGHVYQRTYTTLYCLGPTAR